MCGITGIFDTRAAGPIDRQALQRMNDSLLHRGPDEGSLHIELGLISIWAGKKDQYRVSIVFLSLYNGLFSSN